MTKIDIWNQALALLPHDVRVQGENDTSTEAMRCRDHWDAARQYVLTCAEWSWATMSDDVGGCLNGHGRGFSYARPYALRIIGAFDRRGRRVRSQSFNSLIYTDRPASSIRYIPDRDDTEEWPTWFTDAVVAELAVRIAGPVTGNQALAAAMQQIATKRLEYAKQVDASEVNWAGTDGRTFARARR